jgi:hypothetical protein
VWAPLTPRWAAGLTLSGGKIAAEQVFDDLTGAADLSLRYLVLPHSNVTPYLQIGGGLRTRAPHSFAFGEDLLPQAAARAGIEMLVAPSLGLDLSAGTSYALHDRLDGVALGRYDDSLWSATIGLTYYTNWFQ